MVIFDSMIYLITAVVVDSASASAARATSTLTAFSTAAPCLCTRAAALPHLPHLPDVVASSAADCSTSSAAALGSLTSSTQPGQFDTAPFDTVTIGQRLHGQRHPRPQRHLIY